MTKFQDLSEDAQQRILDERRHWNTDGHDWWDGCFDWFVELLGKAGLSFDYEKKEPVIRFSGFWSQGDGCSFKGRWCIKPEHRLAALMHVAEYPELLSAVRALVAADTRYKGITVWSDFRNSRHVHENTMQFDIGVEINEDPYDIESPEDELAEVCEAMRGIARWMYNRLEKEYDYLTSDECLKEMFYDEDFEQEDEDMAA